MIRTRLAPLLIPALAILVTPFAAVGELAGGGVPGRGLERSPKPSRLTFDVGQNFASSGGPRAPLTNHPISVSLPRRTGCGPLRDRVNQSPVETTEYRGYRIKATSSEDESGKWLARWTADRLSGSGAFSKSGSVRRTVTSEGAADEAALREARAWVDQYGQLAQDKM